MFLVYDGKRLEMNRKSKNTGWLLEQYGENVCPWECELLLSNSDNSIFGKKALSLNYQYERTLNGKT